MDKKNIAKKMGQDYEGLIPEFKSAKEALGFLKLTQKRKCMKCKGSKDKNNNAFYCSTCLKDKATYKKK